MRTEKVCFKCNRLLPISEFYKHSMMLDGTLNKCKVCTKRDVKEYAAANVEKIRAAKREYAARPESVKRSIERTKVYREKYKIRYKAYCSVANAIRDGKLIPRPCEVCGTEEFVHAHHEDYSKPLEVKWLCGIHHKARHKEMKKLGIAL